MTRNFYFFLYRVNKALGYIPFYRKAVIALGWDDKFLKNYYKHLRLDENVSETEVDGYSGKDADPATLISLSKLMLSVNPTPQHILDIGCGSGRFLKQISVAAPGAKLFGVDISKDILEKFTARQVPQAQLQLLDIEHDDTFFKTHKSQFDFIYLNGVIQILSVNKIPETLRKISDGLQPGGLFYVQFPVETESKKSTVGYKRYSIDELSALLTRAGLNVVKSGKLDVLADNSFIFAQKK